MVKLEQIAEETLAVLRLKGNDLVGAFNEKLIVAKETAPKTYAFLENALVQYNSRLAEIEQMIEEGELVGRVQGKHFIPVPDMNKMLAKKPKKDLKNRLRSAGEKLKYADISVYCDAAGKFYSKNDNTSAGKFFDYLAGFCGVATVFSFPAIAISLEVGAGWSSLLAIPIVAGVAGGIHLAKRAYFGAMNLNDKYGRTKPFKQSKSGQLINSLRNTRFVLNEYYQQIVRDC